MYILSELIGEWITGFMASGFTKEAVIVMIKMGVAMVIARRTCAMVASEVKEVLGRRLSLNALASATLGAKKLGSGMESLVWWKNGEVEKVRKYCMEDVRITKELYDYAREQGHLKYRDMSVGGARGTLTDIALPRAAEWESAPPAAATLTHTLPF